jgi:hypothetical protein
MKFKFEKHNGKLFVEYENGERRLATDVEIEILNMGKGFIAAYCAMNNTELFNLVNI